MADKTTPTHRSEAEIAGYRNVLDTIHASGPDIPFTPKIVEQLHRDLCQFTATAAGRWKATENAIEETRPDGSVVVRFEPLSSFETPGAMEELHESFARARRSPDHHPPLVIGCYVFDFLAIHPFSDGYGRMSRLLTLLALYHADYEVGRFTSLERLIIDSQEPYHEALQAAGHGWHDDEHDVTPWLTYFLGITVAAYKEFEDRVGTVAGRGSKAEAIQQFIRARVADEFTVADVRRAAPNASQSYISKKLAALRDQGVITPIGAGKGARWRRG